MKATIDVDDDGHMHNVTVREDSGEYVTSSGYTAGVDKAISLSLSSTRLELKDANRELVQAQKRLSRAIEIANAVMVLQIRYNETK